MTFLGLCFDSSIRGVPSHHDPALVALSFVVAAFASFTALQLADRLRGVRDRARRFWRLAAAAALGGGIWSMHFVAMLAFRVPLAQAYDPALTTLSGLIAIGTVGLGLGVFERPLTPPRLASAGFLFGLGVTAMHYCGMAALRVPGQVFYRPGLFALSAVIAMAGATAALWLACARRSLANRIAAGVVMASAICGMHYTGMAATVIVAGPSAVAPLGVVGGGALAFSVAASMAGVLALALGCAFVDRRFERQTLALAKVEEARRAAEAADRAKSEFLANISHEIRTPLNGVLGLSSLLLRAELAPEQREMVETIEASARTLNVLLSDVLDLAKIEAGRIELDALPFAPADCARHVAGLFAPAAAEKGLAFETEIADEIGGEVVGDATRVTQILTNLCSNAVKFTSEGRVALKAHGADVGDERRLVFEVMDTGVGMSPEACARLFQRFVQVDGSARRRSGGAGLGLSISRTLARLMGGDVTCVSRPGSGSTFTLTLVLPQAPEGRQAPPDGLATRSANDRPPRQGERRPSVLLIEDHPVNRRVVELILADAVRLECAENGALGLAAFEARPFDLVLMDMQMPVMDGLEATRAIRAFEHASGRPHTPIIALSANALADQVEAALAAGADYHIAKPITAEALFEAVERALASAASTESASESGSGAPGNVARRT